MAAATTVVTKIVSYPPEPVRSQCRVLDGFPRHIVRPMLSESLCQFRNRSNVICKETNRDHILFYPRKLLKGYIRAWIDYFFLSLERRMRATTPRIRTVPTRVKIRTNRAVGSPAISPLISRMISLMVEFSAHIESCRFILRIRE